MTTRIALFANRDNAQVAEIGEAVARQGAEPVKCDIQVGGANRVSAAFGDGEARWNGEDLSDVRAYHIRCTAPRTLPALPPVLNAGSHAEYRAGFIREQEFHAATYDFFEDRARAGALVVNRLTGAYVDHDSKSQLYERLRENGFPAPLSLATNDPDAARAFIDRVGEAIVKPSIGVGSTRVVTEADKDRLDELALCPALFQERAPGNTIRVHIVGDTVVLALKIHSDGGVDSRSGMQSFEYIKLPDEDAARIAACNRFLGLHYAAWDVIMSDEGDIKYLDCNPGPFVMWIGLEFRTAVFEELAKYMITFAETGSVEEASRGVSAWTPD